MAKIKITQVRSRIGATERQCRNLDALGLKKMHQSVEHEDSAIILGMVKKVHHLVKVDVTATAPVKKTATKAKAVKKEEESNATE